MAENGDKEEKFEFTPEGEALGYIGLNQARVLAMEHARDHREFYGRRYRNQQLVWEVVEESEDEEYYHIRLSYRPSGRFNGTPGTEQFVLDKTGQIRLRQLLDEPVGRSRPVIQLVIGVVVAIALAVGGVVGAIGLGSEEPELSAIVVVPTVTVAPTSTPTPSPTPTAVPTVIVPTKAKPASDQGVTSEKIQLLIADALAQKPQGASQITADEVSR